ncbi:MAG: hypothetical protein ACERKZ_12350 [Lachnotalea sp.]
MLVEQKIYDPIIYQIDDNKQALEQFQEELQHEEKEQDKKIIWNTLQYISI